MSGPRPKPSHMRQRRNKTTTRATLAAPARKARAPKLPKLPARGRGRGAWHPRVRAWWSDVWKSPMASEYLDVHRHGLEAIAEFRQQFHTADEPSKLLALHAEIRQAQRALRPGLRVFVLAAQANDGMEVVPCDRRRIRRHVPHDRGRHVSIRPS